MAVSALALELLIKIESFILRVLFALSLYKIPLYLADTLSLNTESLISTFAVPVSLT